MQGEDKRLAAIDSHVAPAGAATHCPAVQQGVMTITPPRTGMATRHRSIWMTW
jgi:hypothetical protein